jgi:hypothetical protein
MDAVLHLHHLSRSAEVTQARTSVASKKLARFFLKVWSATSHTCQSELVEGTHELISGIQAVVQQQKETNCQPSFQRESTADLRVHRNPFSLLGIMPLIWL